MSRPALAQSLRDTYLRLDPRTLAVGRIGLGLLLLVDLCRRLPWLRDFYSNAGLLPNHTVLWRPPVPRLFSVFFMSSLPEESALWFAICFVCFFCLLIGYRTRLFHLLSFALVTSLHNRLLPVENGGTMAMASLMLWTAFLPLGRRFSVDAVRASLRARPDETPDLLSHGVPAPDERPAASLAVLALLLQLAVVYWFNYVHKSGPTWRQGTAIYYVLHQERIVTLLGLWVREHVPFEVTRIFSHATLVLEAAVPFLILSPVLWRWTRPLSAVALFGLHLSIGLLVNVGVFSAAMIAFEPFLLTPLQWKWFARLVPVRGRLRTAYYDADCGVCFLLARVLARMDVHRRVQWLPNRDDPRPTDQTIRVVDLVRGRTWTGADACVEILAALPFGRLWTWPARLPGLRHLLRLAFTGFARNRARISAWLGLFVPEAPVPPAPPAPEQKPFRRWMRGRVPLLRELGVATAMLVLSAEISVANSAIPAPFRFDKRPQWMAAAIMYPHLRQGWSMFAPDAPTSDETVYVDAVTREGRHVDPYNEVGSRVAALPVERVPVRLGHDSFWCDYTLRIPDNGAYHQAFTEWILRYPERTGRPQDAIVRFEAVELWQDSPPPGSKEPSNFRKRRFLQWP